MRVLLISTYEMGRQPFGLASAQAWLEREGHVTRCLDLAIQRFDEAAVREADLVAFHLPMHTATRLAAPVIRRVRELNPAARLCAYGLYAPLNEALLRELGVEAVLGGEFEADLTRVARGEAPRRELERLEFVTPERHGLPELERYAKLRMDGETRVAGYTEASRGCKHVCRHCPVAPVYQGRFRVVEREVVLEDIRRQVAGGARHITFGDPDFFNGPTHALRIVGALAREFPGLTYDVTIKIEHLLRQRALIPTLRETGCLFVTSAVESLDDEVLSKLDKGHTRRDFFEVAGIFREAGLTLHPTFIAFTPWTTRESYRELLRVIRDLELVENVSPIQLALRLLIPSGSRLLELAEIRELLRGFDRQALVYRWAHPEPAVDELAGAAFRLVSEAQGASRREVFTRLWRLAEMREELDLVARAAVPYLDEPWYC